MAAIKKSNFEEYDFDYDFVKLLFIRQGTLMLFDRSLYSPAIKKIGSIFPTSSLATKHSAANMAVNH